MENDHLRAALRLSLVPGVGPLTRRALLEKFGSPEAVLSAGSRQLKEVQRVGAKLAGRIADANEIDVDSELETCRQHGIDILLEEDDSYPRVLCEIPDPPAVLFAKGEMQPRDQVAVAIVGTRHATTYGLRQAEQLAGSLARAGLTIVSGLARGIDGAAHRGAMAAGGRTIAVLASGVLSIYPPEHAELAKQVTQQGALVSEAPPRAKPLSGSFPQRNRIITGLSLGVIVVEATQRSGALISARHAMEQNREVFAVPGRVDQRTSRGCHQLLRDGAKLVESAGDVLDELGPLVESSPAGHDERTIHHVAELQLNEQEKRVLDAIDVAPTSIDDVVTGSGLPVHRVLSTISVLEMRHLVRRISGHLVARR